MKMMYTRGFIFILMAFFPGLIFAQEAVIGMQDGQACPADQVLQQKMKKGDRNGQYSYYQQSVITEVALLQGHLNRLGFGSGSVDGVIGPITEGAIRRMQEYLQVAPDGIVGPFTIAAINSSCGLVNVAGGSAVPTGLSKEEIEKKQLELIADLQKKLQELVEQRDAIVGELEDENENEEEVKEAEPESDDPYIVYTVGEGAKIIPDDEDDAREIDAEIWEILLGIIGDEYVEENVRNYILFDDEENDFSAYVIKTNDWQKWDITVNSGLVDFSRGIESDLVETIVHEFNHVFALNLEQVNPEATERTCEVTYWTGEGCSYSDSYINEFVQEFWDAQDLDRQFSEEEIEGGQDMMEEIFDKNPGEYNSYYSVVNPVEDMAESFTLFVLNNIRFDKDTIANEKINFFYDYDELVEMREEIREYLDTLYIVE